MKSAKLGTEQEKSETDYVAIFNKSLKKLGYKGVFKATSHNLIVSSSDVTIKPDVPVEVDVYTAMTDVLYKVLFNEISRHTENLAEARYQTKKVVRKAFVEPVVSENFVVAYCLRLAKD